MNAWGDLIVRARGLSGQLLLPAQYAPLCACSRIPALAVQLATLRVVPPAAAGPDADVHGLELALRRRAGARLRILAHWAGARADDVAPLFDDEDRRSLRTLLRGAVAGVDPDVRLAALVPTPSLPLRALAQLARSGDVASIGAQLLAWRHPFGSAIAEEARRKRPDLLQLEMALTRAFAERSRQASGDPAMRLFVRRIIDLENLWAALLLSEHPADVDGLSVFVSGGALVTADDLGFAIGTRSRAALIERLSPRVSNTPLGVVLTDGPRPAEDAVLDLLVAEFHALARLEPLGLAPVVLFVLRQRSELRTLMRILWSVSLGVPRPALERAIGVAA